VPEVILYPDPRLARAARPRPLDAGLLEIGAQLRAAAEALSAYGLAAAHIGAVEPVVLVSLAADRAKRDYRLLFNPEVTATAAETARGIEGSVSMPGVEIEIVRPVWAEIAFEEADGHRQVLRLENWPARIALHEIEQMQGRFFLEHLSRLKRDMLVRKWRKRPG
jgi:peptide deformylase